MTVYKLANQINYTLRDRKVI